MSIAEAIARWRRDEGFARNVVAWRTLAARPARTAPFPADLDPRLLAALGRLGITQLYTHQAAAVEAALGGAHIAVVTPAASGKTLCYHLPVLQRLLAEPAARALYLYPTKALAHDQLAGLQELLDGLEQEAQHPGRGTERAAGSRRAVRPWQEALLPVAAYDGDTPSSRRTQVREAARIVFSNPDMLHTGILPQHTRWAAFFANLRAVVIDELHVYRGVFGSHVANVLRRLRRICRFYGSNPQFILTSATIANPGPLAERLVEAPVTLVGPEQNGAPQGAKHILLYNPPVVDAELGIRRSSGLEASTLAAGLLANGVQTIVFAGSRLPTELILLNLRERMERDGAIGGGPAGDWAQQVQGYRGGYLPSERRAIESGLRTGQVRAVVATTALELGIDIGQLGAALLAGYPGTIAGAWQQMGRAGRRQGEALALLVATPAPIDQYIVSHPEFLFERSPERALVNPDNPVILAEILLCAAAELPFSQDDGFGTAPGVAAVLDYLTDAGELYRAGGRYYWGSASYPSAGISLRSSSPERVVIQSKAADGSVQVIGELDRPSVPLLLYENAIYLHGGESYRVERLEWEAGVAHVTPVNVEYYTKPSIAENVQTLAEKAQRGEAGGRAQVAWGEVRVVSKASGYRILRRSTHEMLGFGPIELPEQTLDTTACWLAFAPGLIEELKGEGMWLSDPNDYGPEWPATRAAVRARDLFRCQGCGTPELPGKQHDVHHKVPFRAFVADPALRPGLAPGEAWRAANRHENLVTLCSSCHHQVEQAVRTRSGLGGVAALLHGVAPLYLMCDPRDLGLVVEPQAPASRLPTVTLYEKIPGGIGYAAELYELMPLLLRAAHELVTGCPCRRGCPGCVGPILDHDYALDTKSLSVALIERLLPEGNGGNRADGAGVIKQD